MKIFLIILILVVSAALILIIERLMFRKPLSEAQIKRRQDILDFLIKEEDYKKHSNAYQSLIEERSEQKGIYLILSGLALMISFLAFIFFMSENSLVAMTLVICSLVLIILGILKMRTLFPRKLLVALILSSSLLLFFYLGYWLIFRA
ncbi:MAG: hypothetical protein WCZ15_01880 [Patescibacteria group bacterium]|jgi:hypothetical protein